MSVSTYPVRQKTAHSQAEPKGSIGRSCRTCRASFMDLAAGKTGERGIWCDWRWYCSVECAKGHVPDEYLGSDDA